MKRYVGTGYTVYAHTNKTNFKTYFGQTCQEDLTKRWGGGHGYRQCPVFYNAIKKYGWNGFTHEIIKTGLTKDEADALEKECIWFFMTNKHEFGYNVQEGGRPNGKFSDIARPVCAFDCDGNFIAEFPTITAAAACYGISVSRLSTHCTRMTGTCARMIFSYKDDLCGSKCLPAERCMKPYAVKRSTRAVAQYDLDGHFVKRYSSIKEAADAMGVNKSTISGVLCRSDAKGSCVGYQWRYYDGTTNPILPHQPKGGESKIDVKNQNLCQIDSDSGTILHVFKDVTSAASSCGICADEIQENLDGLVNNAGGYTWEYAGDYSKRTGLRTRAVNKRRPVASIDPSTDEIVEKFSSVAEASQKTGIRSSYLFGGLSGRYKTVHGLKWVYLSG